MFWDITAPCSSPGGAHGQGDVLAVESPSQRQGLIESKLARVAAHPVKLTRRIRIREVQHWRRRLMVERERAHRDVEGTSRGHHVAGCRRDTTGYETIDGVAECRSNRASLAYVAEHRTVPMGRDIGDRSGEGIGLPQCG